MKKLQLLSRTKMWTVYTRDQTAHSVQSDLDLLSTKGSCVANCKERVKRGREHCGKSRK